MSQTNHTSRMLRSGALTIVMLGVLAVVYVGAAGPTLYWQPASTGLPSDARALAVAPGASPTLYAGTWGDGVYRSTDHCAMWVAATAGPALPVYIKGGLESLKH